MYKVYSTATHKIINILGIKMKFKHHFKPIYIEEGNDVQIHPAVNKKLLTLQVFGKNNKVIIGNIVICEKLKIVLYGENSTVKIGNGCGIRVFTLEMGSNSVNLGYVKNSKVIIGEKVSMENVNMVHITSNSSILIDDECMFSNGINILSGDNHPLYEKGTKKIINRVGTLKIGKHCWVGKNSAILKNVSLADNTIVGYGSTVTKSILEPNCAIAGVPAKIVRKNVEWDANGSGDYVDNIY